MTFPDHFSDHADRYEAYRPTYPDALFAYLASLVPDHDLAWDCATGNGQAALGLTPHFDAVIATDASLQQIALARPHPKVSYRVAPAERAPLRDSSVDVVSVSLALHWFDLTEQREQRGGPKGRATHTSIEKGPPGEIDLTIKGQSSHPRTPTIRRFTDHSIHPNSETVATK